MVNRKNYYFISLLLCLMVSPLANSQSNKKEFAEGKSLFKKQCARCHSKLIGRKITGSPKLTNLKEAYIVARLTSYAADNGDYTEEKKYKQKMIDAAKTLSESDINNISVYLSTK